MAWTTPVNGSDVSTERTLLEVGLSIFSGVRPKIKGFGFARFSIYRYNIKQGTIY